MSEIPKCCRLFILALWIRFHKRIKYQIWESSPKTPENNRELWDNTRKQLKTLRFIFRQILIILMIFAFWSPWMKFILNFFSRLISFSHIYTLEPVRREFACCIAILLNPAWIFLGSLVICSSLRAKRKLLVSVFHSFDQQNRMERNVRVSFAP